MEIYYHPHLIYQSFSLILFMPNLLTLFRCLLLLLFTTKIISALPLSNDVPGLFIDRLSVSKPGAINDYFASTLGVTPQTSLAFTYPYTWRMALNQTISFGLSVHNYKMAAGNYYFSYQAELQSVTTTGANISVTTTQSAQWIYYMTFNVIIVTTITNNLELMSYQDSFKVLNVAARSFACQQWFWNTTTLVYDLLWTTCYTSTESFNVTSTKFNFLFQTHYSIGCFLQWIMFNQNIPVYIQDFRVFCGGINGTSFVGTTLYSNGIYQNSLHSFKINVLVVDCASFTPYIAYWNISWNTPNVPFSPNFYSPSTFPNPLTEYHCIYGYSATSRIISTPSFFLFGQIGGDIMSKASSLDDHGLFVNCLVLCDYNKFVDYNSFTQLCQLCDSYIFYCRRCNSQTYCYECYPQAALTVYHNCTLCRNVIALCRFCVAANVSYLNCTACYVGRLVDGGCTTVVGCTVVSQVYYPVHYSICVDCEPIQFKYNANSNTCECREGWIVGDYCVKIQGCTATAKVNGIVVCLRCNEINHFTLVDNTCACMKYYEMRNHSCVQICGDGVKISQPCDDGNLIDGDGCDQSCKVQPYYQCLLAPSICKFYGRNISISLVEVNKVQGLNQAVFKFAFKPILRKLALLQLQNYFNFSCQNSPYNVIGWEYRNGQVQLTLDYFDHLQGKEASVNFTFDNYYIHFKPIVLNFTIRGNGNKVLYLKYTTQLKIMCMILFGLSIAAFFLICFGSWSQKLIGAEYIYSLQIIYYSQFGIQNYNSNLSPLQFLGLVGLNMKSEKISEVNFRFKDGSQLINFSSKIIEIDFVAVISVTAFMFICLAIVRILVNKTKAKKIKILKLMAQNNTIYTNLIFPFLISMTIPLFIISSTMFFRKNSSKQATIPLELLSILSFILLSIQGLNFSLSFLRESFKIIDGFQLDLSVEDLKNKKYLSLFQFLLLLSYFCMYLWLSMDIPFSLETMIGVTTLFLIWQLVQRPYQHFIDNLSINCNVIIALSFLIMVLLENMQVISITDNLSSIIVYCYTGCAAFASIISVIRMIKASIRLVKGLKQAKPRQEKRAKGTYRNYEIGQSKQEMRLGLLKDRIVSEKQQKFINKPLQLQLQNENQREQGIARNLDEQFLRQLSKHKQQFTNKKINRLLSERQLGI